MEKFMMTWAFSMFIIVVYEGVKQLVWNWSSLFGHTKESNKKLDYDFVDFAANFLGWRSTMWNPRIKINGKVYQVAIVRDKESEIDSMRCDGIEVEGVVLQPNQHPELQKMADWCMNYIRANHCWQCQEAKDAAIQSILGELSKLDNTPSTALSKAEAPGANDASISQVRMTGEDNGDTRIALDSAVVE